MITTIFSSLEWHWQILHFQKDHFSTQHKAADDKHNASTWKGCDDTGLMCTCCSQDSLIYHCNINKSGEGCGLPIELITRFFKEINPKINLQIMYDIACSLDKIIKLVRMISLLVLIKLSWKKFHQHKSFPDYTNCMKFATSIFHSYAHEWDCQLKYKPQYTIG